MSTIVKILCWLQYKNKVPILLGPYSFFTQVYRWVPTIKKI